MKLDVLSEYYERYETELSRCYRLPHGDEFYRIRTILDRIHDLLCDAAIKQHEKKSLNRDLDRLDAAFARLKKLDS